LDQLLHHAQNNENQLNLFLQLNHGPSKRELLLSYMVTVLTVFFWPFVQLYSTEWLTEKRSNRNWQM
jgi:antibiotic biosynthesis monooxygenase (ABM) superfamily enzyme